MALYSILNSYSMSLKKKFCVKCGTETDLVDTFCPECYFETHEVKVPKRKELRVCSKCGAILVDRFWVLSDRSTRQMLAEQIKLGIRAPENVKVIRVDLDKIKADGSLEVTFELNGNIISRKYPANLSIKKQVCPYCKINASQKSKCTIQLRTNQSFQKFKSEMYDYLRKYIKYISKVKELRTGLDMTVSTRQIGLKISRDIKQKFNMHMKETRKEYSWDRSKNRPKYRSTILLKKRRK